MRARTSWRDSSSGAGWRLTPMASALPVTTARRTPLAAAACSSDCVPSTLTGCISSTAGGPPPTLDLEREMQHRVDAEHGRLHRRRILEMSWAAFHVQPVEHVEPALADVPARAAGSRPD